MAEKQISVKFTADMLSLPENIKPVILDCTGSTNSLCRSFAEKGETDILAVAFSQTAGKGRLQRTFFSPKNTGIYFSLLLSPDISPEDAPLITAAAAVSAAETAEKLSGKNIMIKWVNDIYLKDKKICGILTESGCENGKISFIICGMGINLLPPENGFPKDIEDKAGCLFEECAPETAALFVSETVKKLIHYISLFPKRDFLEEYARRSYLDGKKVEYTLNGQTKSGTVQKIDPSGRLLIKSDDGKTDCLSFGEVSVKTVTSALHI